MWPSYWSGLLWVVAEENPEIEVAALVNGWDGQGEEWEEDGFPWLCFKESTDHWVPGKPVATFGCIMNYLL